MWARGADRVCRLTDSRGKANQGISLPQADRQHGQARQGQDGMDAVVQWRKGEEPVQLSGVTISMIIKNLVAAVGNILHTLEEDDQAE
jgi:hypothetical protein